ncbi:MAG TPA: sugar phosphate isomerase/epimerase family protein [Gemmatimonadales bacterium]|nr:sugar phosphate isomerase/epimerase family protein [Gemmatimonadales bacterium]
MRPTRREFLATAAAVAANPLLTRLSFAGRAEPFRISLAQWSFHKALQAKELDNLDFAETARAVGLEAIEYVNVFFKDKAKDAAYLAELNKRAKDHGVFQHLIMCDGEGRLGDPDAARRTQAVENHYKWADAAKTLGCLTIRVNAASEGSFEEQQKLAADGLRRLTEYGAKLDINVIVENHGGLSSHGDWLVGVMKLVDHPRCGTLPDFGNFYEYDRYQGVADMMPFAKAVSAKSYDFDERGEETKIDYRRMLKLVTEAGFHSWIGIEYEGTRLPEKEGVLKTKALLEKIRGELTTP